MPARVSTVLLLLCAALAVVGACSSGPQRLSAEQFADQANTACGQARTDLEALDPVDVGNPMAAAETVERTTEIQREMRSRLDELHPPAAGDATYDEWIRQIDVVLEQSEQLASALRAGDAAGQTEANQRGDQAVTAAAAAAVELGADECVDQVTSTQSPVVP